MHNDDRHSTHLLLSPGHSRTERSCCYSTISDLPYNGQEMCCGIQQPSSEYGNPRFSTTRCPALYRLSHSRRGPLVGLYDSSGYGSLICCDKELHVLEYNVPWEIVKPVLACGNADSFVYALNPQPYPVQGFIGEIG